MCWNEAYRNEVPVPISENRESTQIVGGFAPRPFFKWKLTYAGAMEVAKKIDAINGELLNFQIKANGGPHFTTETELRGIRRKLQHHE
jgi:hypothetical protein